MLVDDLGAGLLDILHDGDVVTVVDNEVWRGDELLATGALPRAGRAGGALEQARHTLGAELERFATNTLEYLQRERHLATDDPTSPRSRSRSATATCSSWSGAWTTARTWPR